MLTISELFIYPVKALGGITVNSALVTETGFQYDRRWMLVDANNRFITQREFPALALLQVSLLEKNLLIQHKHTGLGIEIPMPPYSGEVITVTIWGDICQAQTVSNEADLWFSEILSLPCRLVYMPENIQRKVDTNYAFHNETTAFSDGYPFLVIGQSSLDDLNSRLAETLPINRFRPNIVFKGGAPYEEDIMAHFAIGDIQFYGVKLCARCMVTTTNQQTAEKGKDPLKTLAKYRRVGNDVYFGQNLIHKGSGIIKIGDIIEVMERKTLIRF